MTDNADTDTTATKQRRRFKSVRKILKSKGARGAEDANKVLDGIVEEWDGLHSELTELPDEDAENMKAHFNELVDGFDRLGDVLFGEVDEFQEYVDPLDNEVKKTYVEEMVKVELISADTETD